MATDSKANKVKVHYLNYPASMDEWRDCSKDPERIGTVTELPVLSPDTLNERFLCFLSKLQREIKLNLFSSKQEDPGIRLEVDIEEEIFQEFLKSVENNSQKRNRFSVKKEELDLLFSDEWDIRVLNKHLDFCFVMPGTIQFWTRKKSPITEFKIISGVPVESQIERELVFVFSFVRGDGNKLDYERRE